MCIDDPVLKTINTHAVKLMRKILQKIPQKTRLACSSTQQMELMYQVKRHAVPRLPDVGMCPVYFKSKPSNMQQECINNIK